MCLPPEVPCNTDHDLDLLLHSGTSRSRPVSMKNLNGCYLPNDFVVARQVSKSGHQESTSSYWSPCWQPPWESCDGLRSHRPDSRELAEQCAETSTAAADLPDFMAREFQPPGPSASAFLSNSKQSHFQNYRNFRMKEINGEFLG